MLERTGELKTTLVKSSSQLPLSGSRLKRSSYQMEDAMEPAKVRYVLNAESKKGRRDKDQSLWKLIFISPQKRTQGMGAVTKFDTSCPRGSLLSKVSQTQGHTAGGLWGRVGPMVWKCTALSLFFLSLCICF